MFQGKPPWTKMAEVGHSRSFLELQQLRKNYARVMRAFSAGEGETHRYGV